jgi:two-component system LytT family response regulator
MMDNVFEYLMTECHNYKMQDDSALAMDPDATSMIDKLLSNNVFHDNNAALNSEQCDIEHYESNVTSIPLLTEKDFITVKSVGKIELIPFEDIYWLNASSNYIEIHLLERSILHRDSLVNLEKKLEPFNFLRVHRSSIINLKCIKSIESSHGRYNSIVLSNAQVVKLSGAYRPKLFDFLGVDEETSKLKA